MKLLGTASVLALSAFVLTACSDSSTTGVEISDLAGSWTATSFAYTDAENSALTIDAIEVGGSVTLDIQDTGEFTGSLNIPNLTPHALPIGGTISIVNDHTMSVNFDTQTESYGLFSDFDAEYTLNGNTLTWTNNDTSFDFPDILEESLGIGARGEVPAILTATFTR